MNKPILLSPALLKALDWLGLTPTERMVVVGLLSDGSIYLGRQADLTKLTGVRVNPVANALDRLADLGLAIEREHTKRPKRGRPRKNARKYRGWLSAVHIGEWCATVAVAFGGGSPLDECAYYGVAG